MNHRTSSVRATGRRVAFAFLLPAVLSACGGALFGGSESDPLPGERISILSLRQVSQPDPRIADLQVRLPRPRINADWPQAGGQPTHVMQHLSLSDDPQRIWSADIGSGSGRLVRLLAPPVVGDSAVYTLDAKGRVSALTTDRGQRIWQINITPDSEEEGALGGGVALADGVLYASTGYGDVVAFNAATGVELWRERIGIPLRAAPTISEGRLFVVTYNNQLFALDADDGGVLWTYVGIAETAGLIGTASPAADGGVVVAPLSSGELVGLRADDGRVVWSDTLARTGRVTALAELSNINGRPAIQDGIVYAVSHAGRMVAIDVNTGARVWTQNIGGVESPWIAGQFIYLITTDAEVLALSRRDGRIRWVTQLPRFRKPAERSGRITWSGPVLASDRLILVSSLGLAVAISPYTGEMLGEIKLPGGAMVAPVLADETLYVLTDDGDLVAYR